MTAANHVHQQIQPLLWVQLNPNGRSCGLAAENGRSTER